MYVWILSTCSLFSLRLPLTFSVIRRWNETELSSRELNSFWAVFKCLDFETISMGNFCGSIGRTVDCPVFTESVKVTPSPSERYQTYIPPACSIISYPSGNRVALYCKTEFSSIIYRVTSQCNCEQGGMKTLQFQSASSLFWFPLSPEPSCHSVAW